MSRAVEKLKLSKLKVGDVLYMHYISEHKLNSSRLIVIDDTIRVREAIGRCLLDEDFIVAETEDGTGWFFIGLEITDRSLYLVSSDGENLWDDVIISQSLNIC